MNYSTHPLQFRSIILIIITLCHSFTHAMHECDDRKKEANRQLLEAAQSGSFTRVKRLIKEGIADINTTNDNQSTPLILAACQQYNQIIRYLVEAGAHVNATNKWGITALALTANLYNTTIAEMLIEAGAEPNTNSKNAKSALALAIDYGNTKLINILIAAKAYIPCTYKIRILELAIDSIYKNLPFQIINPRQKLFEQKNIETLLMIYKNSDSMLSELPKELIKVIITYAHPEYVIDTQTIASLDSTILVDMVPAETLAILVKNNVLRYDGIVKAWENKVENIAKELMKSRLLSDTQILSFKDKTLDTVEALLK